MPKPSAELTWDVREIRVQATHAIGADPSLAGVAVFLVDETGQWRSLVTWDVGPFDGQHPKDEIERHLHKLVSQILG